MRAAPDTSDTLKESSDGVAAVRLDLRVAAEPGVDEMPIAVRGELAPRATLCDSSASLTPCENVEETNCGARVANPASMEWLEATELAASPGVAAGAAGLRAPLRMLLWSRDAEKSTPSARKSSTDEASMPVAEVGAAGRAASKPSPSLPALFLLSDWPQSTLPDLAPVSHAERTAATAWTTAGKTRLGRPCDHWRAFPARSGRSRGTWPLQARRLAQERARLPLLPPLPRVQRHPPSRGPL